MAANVLAQLENEWAEIRDQENKHEKIAKFAIPDSDLLEKKLISKQECKTVHTEYGSTPKFGEKAFF